MEVRAATEAKLLLIGIPLLIWTLIPIYHLFLFSISSKDSATSGRLWPKEPTLQNFKFVFLEKHFYLEHFWLQLWQLDADRRRRRRDHALRRHHCCVRDQPA